MNSCDSLEHHFSTSVRDIVGNRHESAARLLLPVLDNSGQALPWSALIPSTPLTVNTSWACIRHLTDRDIDPPYAHLHPETADYLTHALGQGRDPLCWFALWKGYADVLQEQSPFPAPPPDLFDLIRTAIEPLTVPDARPTDALILQEPLSWLIRHAGELGSCAPLLIHAADGAFTAACPIYHDSIYLAGSRRLIEQVIASRPETFEIELDSPIPGSGEILD